MDSPSHFIIGTAGHIDHGKTRLVTALTGIDADRLKEERERGMTIDLGYAFLDVGGRRVGIVDVPGHEKFIKNMLAGATGIDLALLVVAADDGVMPQTVEHLEILDLLGVNRGIVAITKIDLADDEMRSVVREEVENLIRGTALDGAEIVEVSAETGEGLDDLKDRIGRMVAGAESRRPLDLPFRMPIDRVFAQEGFGCVVTGSVIAGSVERGATLEIFPRGIEVRVRGIQVHGEDAEQAAAGQRTGINLSGVKADELARGDVLSEPGHLVAADLVDVHLQLLDTAGGLKHNARVRLHVGTSEIMARVSLLAGSRLKSGESGFAQLKLEHPASVQRGDRYVIRSYSPMRTIGGGRVLRRKARRLRRNRPEVIEALERLNSDSPEAVVEQTILDAPPFTLTARSIAHEAELSAAEVENALRALRDGGKVALEKELLGHESQVAGIRQEIINILSDFHEEDRISVGIVPAQLMSRLRTGIPRDTFLLLMKAMTHDGLVKEVNGLYALAGFEPRLSAEERAAAEKLEAVFESAGLSPPSLAEAIEQAGGRAVKADQVLQMLIQSRRLTRISESLCFHVSAIEGMKAKVLDALEEKGSISVAELKGLLGVSRKYAIPLAEHLDKIGVTQRVGDVRVAAK